MFSEKKNVVYLHHFGCRYIGKFGSQAWKLCLESVPGEKKAEGGYGGGSGA